MLKSLYKKLRFLKGSFFHPQWLSGKTHSSFSRSFTDITNKHILNIGSGDSILANKFQSSNTIVQLDYPLTNSNYEHKPEIYGTATCLPFGNDSFDIVLLLEVLEHIPNDQQALMEAYRVLKPEGRIFLSTPFMYPIHDAPYDFRRYTRYGVSLLLTTAKFNIERVFERGNALTAVFLLLNIALLQQLKYIESKSKVLAVFLLPFVYFICLGCNTIGAIFQNVFNDTSCTKYAIIASKKMV